MLPLNVLWSLSQSSFQACKLISFGWNLRNWCAPKLFHKSTIQTRDSPEKCLLNVHSVDIKFLCTNNWFLAHICFSGTGQLGDTDVVPFFCSLLQSPFCSLQNLWLLLYLHFLNSATVALQLSGSYSMVAVKFGMCTWYGLVKNFF